MLKNVRDNTKRIFKDAGLALYGFSFILIIFSVGLFALAKFILAPYSGIFKIFFCIIMSFLCDVVAAPLIVGAYEWISQLAAGKTTPMKNAFERFSDLASLIQSQRIFICVKLSLVTAVLPAVFMLCFTAYSSSEALYGNFLFIIAAFILSFRLLCGIFPLMHIMLNAPHVSFLSAIQISFLAMRGKGKEFVSILFGFIWKTIVSALSFGALSVYMLPRILCTAVLYSDAVFEEKQLYKYNLYY